MNEQEKRDWVYARLEDEESKFIFENRVLFNETKDYGYIEKIIEKYLWQKQDHGIYHRDEELRIIKAVQDKGQKLIIFGAGFQGLRFLHICMAQGIHVEYFCDNAPEKQNKKAENNVLILSLQELMKRLPVEQCAFVISPESAQNDICGLLLENGVPEENIYLYNKPYIAGEVQYFEDGLIEWSEKEVFVDGGCLDMSTSEVLLEKAQKCGFTVERIYAYEPDRYNLKICQKKISGRGWQNINLIDAGLWGTDTYLGFSSDGNGGSRIMNGENTRDQIRCVAIDSSIHEKITFIKMDIEGAEMEALKGAEKSIRKYKPKLAVCIYHKKEDMWEIPFYIKTLVPEYKLYIRHYSNCEWETVLYAVI